MKNLILAFALCFGFALNGFSQEQAKRSAKTPEERAQKVTNVLDKRLALSENQKTQIYQIALERARAMNNLRADKQTIDRAEVKAQLRASEEKILAVLNESQRVSYAQLKEERKEKMKKHHKNQKRGERTDKA